MCEKDKEEVPNMTLLAKPCKKAIIISEDKVEEFLKKDNKAALQRALIRSKRFSHNVTDNTKGKN